MEDRELETLLRDLESDRTERKASASERDKIRQAICAFANDLPSYQKPGIIFIGANDNGTCANLPITDELLRILADMRSDGNITPFPTMTVQKRNLYGCELVVIVVEPSDAPPVRFQGRVWIRVGPRRAVATEEEERRLTEKRRSRNLPFDIWPDRSATLDDLDFDLFRRVYLPSSLPADVIEQNQRSIEFQLSSLRFATVGPQPKPTHLGILVIGKDPRQFLPGAYIQFLRFDGTELTDSIKDQKEIGGSLPDLLRMLDEIFHAHISVSSNITGQPVEVRAPDYPIVALQQLARNGVLHRTYEGTNAPVRINWFSDRIEILSPGGLYGQVTRANFGNPGVRRCEKIERSLP
ncbi:MAG: transcriptional regulator [Deltaproteobacteria bacterium RBG_13_53_10]|nr:MAG: transcriptional regulator [Deltaproteobacteria bacterium RBG_13_53_10]